MSLQLVFGGQHRFYREDDSGSNRSLSRLVVPYELKGLLQNRNILKTGVNIKGKPPLQYLHYSATRL
jgi:hypothetical protein